MEGDSREGCTSLEKGGAPEGTIALERDTMWKRILERDAHHWKWVEHWKGHRITTLDQDKKWKGILERDAHHWKRVEHWKGHRTIALDWDTKWKRIL